MSAGRISITFPQGAPQLAIIQQWNPTVDPNHPWQAIATRQNSSRGLSVRPWYTDAAGNAQIRILAKFRGRPYQFYDLDGELTVTPQTPVDLPAGMHITAPITPNAPQNQAIVPPPAMGPHGMRPSSGRSHRPGQMYQQASFGADEALPVETSTVDAAAANAEGEAAASQPVATPPMSLTKMLLLGVAGFGLWKMLSGKRGQADYY